MLSGMGERMKKMELYQVRIAEDEPVRRTIDSGMFELILGADFSGRLHQDACECAKASSTATFDGSGSLV